MKKKENMMNKKQTVKKIKMCIRKNVNNNNSDDAAAETELLMKIINNLISLAVNLFNCIVINETHQIKSINTEISQNVYKINVKHHILVSVIIMINQSVDLFRAFNLLMSHKNLSEDKNENLNFFTVVTEALNKCFKFSF